MAFFEVTPHVLREIVMKCRPNFSNFSNFSKYAELQKESLTLTVIINDGNWSKIDLFLIIYFLLEHFPGPAEGVVVA